MRQPQRSVLPISPPDEAHDPPGRRRDRPNLTERVAGWSAAHRKTAVFGWLLLVAAIFMAGQALGSRNLPEYSSGQAGQAERVLNQYAPAQLNALTESVLIQRTAPGGTFATDPAMRQAAAQVATALAAHPNSLFYLRREREERARGRSFPDALRIAGRPSGRTILVSGLTVMAGLFFVGGGPFSGFALGTIAVVGIAVIGSLTVLPALLAWLGPKSDAGRIPFLSRRRAAAQPSRLWEALARRVVARPVIWGGVATVALLALAAPVLGLRLGQPAVDAPKDFAVVQTMAAIQRAYPQAPSPAQVVVTGVDVTGPKVLAAVDALRAEAAAGGAIHAPVTTTVIGGGRALVVDVPLAGNGADTASDNALQTLRNQILPDTFGKIPGASYPVTGDTASTFDIIHTEDASLPLVFGFVAVLAFVLLLVAFRSVLVSLVSIALNLLSVGAAYGLVVLIFQDGRLQGPLDYTSFGGIIFWVPVMMFVFLFGISMDYHVFILSRIREIWARGSSPKQAIVGGIASSGGVVTSAALIMVALFSLFATPPLIDLKILGVGPAAAVLIDATVVRGVLVPAALALLGDRAWSLRRRRVPLAPAVTAERT